MKPTIPQAQNVILQTIEKCNQPIARKAFIRNCVESLEVPLADNETPGGELNQVKCLLGMLLQQYIRTGIIKESDAGLLQYSADVKPKEANRNVEIENILRDITKDAVYEREKLLDVAYDEYTEQHPNTEVDDDERNAIRGDIGNVLKRLVEDCVIPGEDGKFGVKPANHREMMKQEIAAMSAEEFEAQTMKMLTAYLKKNRCAKVTSKITDGPDDDGVDGVITLPDKFLKNDKIIVQVKHREKADRCEPLKEVRGFAGVLAAQANVYKGIYVTSAKYHCNVNKFINSYSLKQLLLIDGEKWVDMAESCGYLIYGMSGKKARKDTDSTSTKTTKSET